MNPRLERLNGTQNQLKEIIRETEGRNGLGWSSLVTGGCQIQCRPSHSACHVADSLCFLFISRSKPVETFDTAAAGRFQIVHSDRPLAFQ